MAHAQVHREFTVRPPQDEAELRRFGEIILDVFRFPPERVPVYLASVGRENMRCIYRNGDMAGGLAVLPCGQFFGGRPVPMAGIAVVGVSPEHRSTGVASHLMRQALHELHANGCALSTLYPATRPVYRRAGYELAGVIAKYSLPTASIDCRSRDLELRRATPADHGPIADTYRAWAVCTPGYLDRTDFFWNRVRSFRGRPTDGYVVLNGGRVEGYIYYAYAEPLEVPYTLELSDILAVTPAAARRLLTFLADHRSLVSTVTWQGGPREPLLMVLAEPLCTVTSHYQWMLRLVHVPNALAARGYPASLTAELHLDVRDDVLPANNGRFVLRVQEGRGTAEAGGRGSLRIDVRALAALYSGHLSAEQLAVVGGVEGGVNELAMLSAVFAGAAPTLRDAF